METTRATLQATLLDLLPGNPASLLYEKKTRYQGGSQLFRQKVNVPDTTLFQRLCHEVNKGDEIILTIVTEWHEDHSIAYVSAIETAETAPAPACQSATF